MEQRVVLRGGHKQKRRKLKMFQLFKRKYSDLTIQKKIMILMGSFSGLLLLIIVVATYGLLKGNLRIQTLYSKNMIVSRHVSMMKEAVQRESALLETMYISNTAPEGYKALLIELSEAEAAMREGLDGYAGIISGSPVFAETERIYTEEYCVLKDSILGFLEQGAQRQALKNLEELVKSKNQVMEQLQILEGDNELAISNIIKEAQLAFKKQLIYTIPLLLLAIAITVDQSSRMKRFITDRIIKISKASDRLADGHIDIELDIIGLDEIGMLARAFSKMADGIAEQVKSAEKISNGDFTVGIPLRSDSDILGNSLQKIAKDLNNTLLVVDEAAKHVKIGADQVSGAAGALAANATEQAASVEELNASLDTIAEQAEENSKSVAQATEFVLSAGEGVGQSNELIHKLNDAMSFAGQHSKQVSGIVKTIEDLASQTNLLALNAIIEAARAGNAGRGFAVVAEEVEKLAGSSDKAAKQAKELIQQCLNTVEQGQVLTKETVELLENVTQKAKLAEQSIKTIQVATAEQTMAIEMINQGLSHVSQAVQSNAATAEESSASSEELAAQAYTLQKEFQKFQLDKEEGLAAESTDGL
jgi:methyl-accepting chemotaxis protein